MIYGIFSQLAFGPFTIYINNRKLLRGLLESLGIAGRQHADVLHEVDRLGKHDARRGRGEARRAIEPDADTAKRCSTCSPRHRRLARALAALHAFEPANANFTEGLAELEQVYDGTLALGVPATALKINLAIARGLDYYTGTVYETFLTEHPKLGSICSGGRYANLASHYTKSKLPGVGISIGATRLFSQLLELGRDQGRRQGDRAGRSCSTSSRRSRPSTSQLAAELRSAGINTEVYGGDDKLGKQLKYADRAGVPLAILYGSREHDAGIVKLKLLRENREVDVARRLEIGAR